MQATALRRACEATTPTAWLPANMTLPVKYLHVSNSGGQSACGFVHAQHVSAPSGRGCALKCGKCRSLAECGGWNCLPTVEASSCGELAQSVGAKRLRFFMTEQPLREMSWDGRWLCPQFRYVMIVKDPIRRVLSEVARLAPRSYKVAPDELLRTWLAGRCPAHRPRAPRCLQQGFVLHDAPYHALMGTPAISNYLSRMLLGPPAFFRSLVDEDHHRATCVLASFSLVVPLEELDEALRSGLFLQRVLGTAESRVSDPRRPNAAPTPPTRLNYHELANANVSADTAQQLAAVNQLDLALVAYARQMWRMMVVTGSGITSSRAVSSP